MADYSVYGGASLEFSGLLSTLPAPTEQTPSELQALHNRNREDASEQEMRVLSPKVLMRDHTISTPDGFKLEARTYRPVSAPEDELLPIYIHFHGGGFLFGTLNSEDATCSRIADATAWLGAEEAFDWAVENATSFLGDPEQIVVGGISAGGHLSASLAQTLTRDGRSGPLKGQVLMIPITVMADIEWRPLSKAENEFAPILPLSRMKLFNDLVCPKSPSVADQRANPGLASAEEVSSLPPTTIGVCGLDPLRDEALLYAKLLAENGVAVNVHLFKGVPHGFRRFGDKLSLSQAWDNVMHDGIRWALNQPIAGGAVDLRVHTGVPCAIDDPDTASSLIFQEGVSIATGFGAHCNLAVYHTLLKF